MSRKLYLIRHAKSSWKDLTLSDFDRPLNKRGKRDAPFMAKLLKGKNISFDKVVCSPAKRTRSTAKVFLDILNHTDIIYDENVYEVSYKDLLKIVKSTDKNIGNIAIIGHNPSLNDLCEYLCKCIIGNIPTSGCVCIDIDSDWKDIKEGRSRLEFFEYPKKYFT
jgi:phosphohistidine phosphatase